MHEKQYFAEHTKHRGYFLNLQTKSKLIKKTKQSSSCAYLYNGDPQTPIVHRPHK